MDQHHHDNNPPYKQQPEDMQILTVSFPATRILK